MLIYLLYNIEILTTNYVYSATIIITGEFNSTGIGKACQSVAPATTKYPTNHPQICDNNNKINNHNNAEHNQRSHTQLHDFLILNLKM